MKGCNEMRIRKRGTVLLFIFALLLTPTIGGCSSSGSSGEKTTIVIGTAGSGGTYYAVGAGMSQIISQYSSKVEAVSQGTKGAIENVRLVHSGNIQVGFGNWDALYFGYKGTGPFKGEKQNIVALINLYRSGGQMAVLKDSSIQSYRDLKGKRVNLGPQGSTITEMSKIILKAYGIDYKKDIQAYYLDFNEGGDKLKDGDLDATFYVAGIPTAGLMNLSNSADIRLLSLEPDIQKKIIQEYPYYEKLTIKAGTYKGVDYDVNTLQLWTALMVSPDMKEDTAYELVKTMMEHVDELQKVHETAKDITLENAAKSPIPMHPGAVKYFKEKGIDVQEEGK